MSLYVLLCVYIYNNVICYDFIIIIKMNNFLFGLTDVVISASATRFHDLRGGASVCRVGTLFRHAAFSDHARPFGPEQGQLECHGARGVGELRGGGIRTGPSHKRAQFQSLISGKPRVMTPQHSQNTSAALSQTSYATFELLATHLLPTTDDLFSSFSFIR